MCVIRTCSICADHFMLKHVISIAKMKNIFDTWPALDVYFVLIKMCTDIKFLLAK